MRVKNSTLVVGLCAALGVALLVIVTLLWNSKKEHTRGPPVHPRLMQPIRPPQPRPLQTPPQQQMNMAQMTPPVNQPKLSRPSIVMFHASWCHNCTAMMPSWQQMKITLAQTNQIQVLDFEDKQHKDLMKAAGIKGFPTIRYYPQGFSPATPPSGYAEYRGNRTTASLLAFAKSGGQQS